MDEPRTLVVALSPEASDIVRERLSVDPWKTAEDVVNEAIRSDDNTRAIDTVTDKIDAAVRDPRPRLSAEEFSARLEAMIERKRRLG